MLRLASASPRRIELLGTLGVAFDVMPATIDERAHASPSRAKADAVGGPAGITLAADTEVIHDGGRIGKPSSDAEALGMLATLAGDTHDVRTELVVVGASGRRLTFAVTSRVSMKRLSLREIERYIGSGEPLDKAGAYAIQGEGRRLVAGYEGCLANITGLPLCHAYFALRRMGVATAERPERACQAHFAFTCPVWRSAQRQGRALRDGAEFASWRDDVSGTVAS